MRWEQVASARMAQAFPVAFFLWWWRRREKRLSGAKEASESILKKAKLFFFFFVLLFPSSLHLTPPRFHSVALKTTETYVPATAEMKGLSAMIVPISTLDNPLSER